MSDAAMRDTYKVHRGASRYSPAVHYSISNSSQMGNNPTLSSYSTDGSHNGQAQEETAAAVPNRQSPSLPASDRLVDVDDYNPSPAQPSHPQPSLPESDRLVDVEDDNRSPAQPSHPQPSSLEPGKLVDVEHSNPPPAQPSRPQPQLIESVKLVDVEDYNPPPAQSSRSRDLQARTGLNSTTDGVTGSGDERLRYSNLRYGDPNRRQNGGPDDAIDLPDDIDREQVDLARAIEISMEEEKPRPLSRSLITKNRVSKGMDRRIERLQYEVDGRYAVQLAEDLDKRRVPADPDEENKENKDPATEIATTEPSDTSMDAQIAAQIAADEALAQQLAQQLEDEEENGQFGGRHGAVDDDLWEDSPGVTDNSHWEDDPASDQPGSSESHGEDPAPESKKDNEEDF